MEIAGFAAAFVIGITLGLMGGGGSILAVPVLVYMLGISPVLATAYSLFVVGIASLTGAINNIHKGQICFKTAVVFAIPSFIAVYLTRLYLIPAIPEHLFDVGTFAVTKDMAIMVFFALIMLVAAFSMIRKGKEEVEGDENTQPKFNYPLILLEGGVVGVLTGIVGAGGGFLIIPALVLLAKLPMKLAVGTSLLIVAAKSLIGFIGDLQTGQVIDWTFLLTFTGFAAVGIFVGGYLSNFISGKSLKRGFGWFVLVMAVLILAKEIM